MSEQSYERRADVIRSIDAFPGVVRRTLHSGEAITLVEIAIATGHEVPEHVHPHEPALRAYLSKRFPALPDHDDLVQETYARILRVDDPGRLTHPKAFLFTTARNVAIDLFRRRGFCQFPFRFCFLNRVSDWSFSF